MKRLFPAVLLFCACAAAQNTTGTISGIARDPTDASVGRVRVTVRNAQSGPTRSVLTNAEGEYRVVFLPVGSYSVQAQKDGFRGQIQKGVTLEILQVRSVDFTLELGAVAETVTVETGAPLLDTESSQAGEVIRNAQVNNLPLNVRQFMQLSFLAPMATPAANDFRSSEINRDTSVPASAGQRPEHNNYQIDGIDNKENGRNSFAISPPVDSIGEFKVQTGLAPAEFGRGDGNLSKSGRNLDRFYDVNAFRLLAAGGADRLVGNAGRNILVSPGVNNFDLQLYKNTRIRESHALEFRWEMFNAWNHTQFGGPGTNLQSATTFGKVTSTRAPRIMQFVLKYGF